MEAELARNHSLRFLKSVGVRSGMFVCTSWLQLSSLLILDYPGFTPPRTDLWAIFEPSQFFPRQLSQRVQQCHKGLEYCSPGCGGFAQNAWERFCLWNGAKIHFKKSWWTFQPHPNLSSESPNFIGVVKDSTSTNPQPNLCWQLLATETENGQRTSNQHDAQNGTVGASHAAELGFVWLGADGWSLGHGAAEPVSVVPRTHQGYQGPGGGFCWSQGNVCVFFGGR